MKDVVKHEIKEGKMPVSEESSHMMMHITSPVLRWLSKSITEGSLIESKVPKEW